jgi:hypothetical protein
LGSPNQMSILDTTHITTLLGWIHTYSFPWKHSMFLEPPIVWDLHFSLDSTFTASWISPQRVPSCISNVIYHLDFHNFLWNVGGSLHDLTALAFLLFAKLALHRVKTRTADHWLIVRAHWNITPLDYEGLGSWAFWNKSWVNNFPR